MPKTSQAPPRGGFHFPRSPCLCFPSSAWLADPGFLEIESGSVLPEPHLGVQVPGQGLISTVHLLGCGTHLLSSPNATLQGKTTADLRSHLGPFG